MIDVKPLCELSLEAPRLTAKKWKMASASTVNPVISFDAFQMTYIVCMTYFQKPQYLHLYMQLIWKQTLLLREKTQIIYLCQAFSFKIVLFFQNSKFYDLQNDYGLLIF